MKQVLDPEIPSDAFHIAEDGRTPSIHGIPESRVIDSYSENALETAIQLREDVREDGGEGTVTALTLGDEGMDEALRRAYAFTADRAVRVWDPSWEDLDGVTTGVLLAQAVEALGGADVILCGREASDVEEAVVGPAIAEALDFPCMSIARRIEMKQSRIQAEREFRGMVEILAADVPVVVTVTSSDANVPRMPKVRDVMLAKGKSIRVLGAADLGIEGTVSSRIRLQHLRKPESQDSCEFIEGASGTEVAGLLLDQLARDKVL